MIKSRLQAITLILLIFLSPFYFSDFVPNVNANPDWLTGWQYRKSHVINPASGAGTNYQIRIKVYYGSGTDSGENVYLNGKCRSDFGDIRFTDDDGITLLDYWMESKVDSNYAIFWVEVADDLSTNSATIYIYYGKSDATTTSNGDNTFIFFDDFSSGSIDWTNKWYSSQKSYYRVENYMLKCARPAGNTGFIRTKNAYNENARVFYDMKMSATGSQLYCYWADNPSIYGGTNAWSRNDWKPDASTYTRVGYRKSDGTEYIETYSDSSYNAWRKVTHYVYQNKVRIVITDSSGNIVKELTEKTDAAYGYDRYLKFLQWGTGYYAYIDNVRIAKYVSPEPGHGSWGSEETPIIERFAYQTLNIQTSPFRQSSYSRTASQTIQILTYASRYLSLPRLASQLVNFVADATRQLSYERTSATQLLILTQTLRQTSYTRTANQLLNILIDSSRQTSYNRLINIPLNIIAEATRLRTSVRSVDQQLQILLSASRRLTLNRFASQELTFLTQSWLTKVFRRFASQVLTILTEATRHQAFHRLVNQPLEILLSASRKAFYHRTAEVLLKIHTATSIKFILYIEVPIPTPTPTPAPALPSIQLDAIIQTAHIARLWWKPTSTIEVLVINKGIVATDVTFEYVMLDINNQTVARGQQTVFISGLDKKTITINILTPPDGTYTVHFQTTAPVKVEAKTVTLTVETPFYGKLSFTILLIMLAVLIIYLASRRKRR